MRAIGVDSVPLAGIVAAFIGAVIAIQTRYQLFQGVQLSLVGLATRQTIILELGPLLTGLVLTGRVGARMTAEIGTMRVTEQVDALETLAYDPIAYLVVPRLLAALVMLPILVVLADAIGVVSGFLMAVIVAGVPKHDFLDGLRLAFDAFQIVYSLLKAVLFGGAIALLPVFARDILHVGPSGLGLLRSTPAVGALAAGILLTRRPIRRHAGRTLLVVVAAFGASMVVFGVSRWFPLSLAALAVSGFVDMFSMNIRSTTVALATPPELLGRVSAVNAIFVGSSNELGAFESGVAARLLGTVTAVVAGGFASLGVVAVIAARVPQLRRLRRIG
jgi:phospholipid/cholesterol/gamma-HCH transport system permease protein